MRIRTKTAIMFLVLSLAPLAFIGVIAYQKGKEAIKTSLGVSFQRIAHETMDKVDRSLYEVYHDVQTWAELELMQEVITGDVDGKISSFFMGLSKEYGYYSSISALNSEGVVIASSNPELIGRDFSQEASYRDTIRGGKRLEDIRFDQIDKAWVVTFCFPIKAKFGEDKILGVLSAKWKADKLFNMTQLNERPGEEPQYVDLLLIQSNGLIISAPESEKQDIFKGNLIKLGLKSALHASQKEKGYLIEMDERNNPSLIGYDYSEGYRDFPSLGWAALVIQDVNAVFAPIERLKIVIFSVGVLVALFVIAISLMVTRTMTHPILKISQIATRVARGDFEGKADYASGDEIGSLAQAFNQMIQDLKKQRAQLVDKHYVDSIIANMINTLIVVDPNGVIMTVNKATLDVLGYREEELIGQQVSIIFAEGLPFKWPGLDDLIEKGFISNTETTYLSKNRKKIPVFFSGSVMRDLNDKIKGIILVAQDITERKRAEEALAEQAIRDALTNLYNRRYFNHRIEEEIARADRNKQCLAILLCDLDHFKTINDTRGHQVGDEVLKAVARGIQQSTRGTDLVFRWGGDEIVVVLSDATREGFLITGDRIRKAVRTIGENAHLDLDLSIGVALYPEHGDNVDELMCLADRALYIAKKGGDKVHIGEEEYRLDEHTIKVVFQPVVDLGSNQVLGYEALSRDPQGSNRILGYEALSRDTEGKLSILELFRRYEAIGRIDELRRICFRSQLKTAQEFGLKRIFINANFDLLNQLEGVPKPPDTEVVLEISELEALHDVDNRLKLTKKWRELGYQFAIDDFGAGFISLPFIAQVIPDYIKLDRSTILQAVTSEKFRKFLKDLVLALQNYVVTGIIAEGIETEKELKVVKSVGIHLVQGFLFGKPK